MNRSSMKCINSALSGINSGNKFRYTEQLTCVQLTTLPREASLRLYGAKLWHFKEEVTTETRIKLDTEKDVGWEMRTQIPALAAKTG